MHHLGFLTSKCDFPKASSPDRAALGLERWLEAAGELHELADFARQAAADSLGKQFLQALFGNSPFLTEAILKDPAFSCRLIQDGPDATFTAILDNISSEDLGKNLRIAKRQVALTVAAADITGVWGLEQVTNALSEFAETALRLAAAKGLVEAAALGAFTLPFPDHPEKGSGLIILALGKLGARELNYSSDIDLIVLFDRDKVITDDAEALQHHFQRLTRGLVKLMDERTTEGYVFRTDLRLRPDPGVNPVALSVMAAETYYETVGQNWERAAMIKARPVAGDIEAGHAFLKRLAPYIWRKNLDFAAIQDIHSIKRQINAHKGGETIAAAGHNIKLGRGGIREIEFFAQTQQLIWGGREVELRSSVTCETLKALIAAGHCTETVAGDLIQAYEFLRRLEHRLQMVNDEQTQILPSSLPELEKIAVFLGFPGHGEFAQALLGQLHTVRAHYSDLFNESPSLGAEDITGGGNLVFTGGDVDPETLATIKSLGFSNPVIVDKTVRGWHHGRCRATRSTRAREILTELMPAILKAIAATPSPDDAFLRFDRFISGLPSGVQLFSMFHSNPDLLDLVAEIMGKAPRLAQHLSRHSSILDSVLTQDFFDPPPDLHFLTLELMALLGRADHIEQIFDISRRWNSDRRFQVGVQCLRGVLAPGDAARAFSAIAEAALATLFPFVEEEFAEKHGRVPGLNMAVLAMGKLGSREMAASSDLDLVFIYGPQRDPQGNDSADDDIMSDGEKPLSPLQYFGRLSQRFINAITIATGEGALYEVDMRLRPSGNKGPIASTLDGFVKYHQTSAWTWERMSLTRARVILGPEKLGARINAAVLDILTTKRSAEDLLCDVADMRTRLDKERHTECLWAVKNLRGGLVDLEFITQYLTLLHAPEHPDIIGYDTPGKLMAIMAAGLLDKDTGKSLTDAWRLWQGLQQLLALTIEGELTVERVGEISDALRQDLVKTSAAKDFEDLEATMQTTADAVYNAFKELIDVPAGKKRKDE